MGPCPREGNRVMSKVAFGDLETGTAYRVHLSDCCIEGYFDGTFEAYEYDDEGDPDRARFDVGVIGPYWGQFSFERIEE